jgi:hypothetical protein
MTPGVGRIVAFLMVPVANSIVLPLIIPKCGIDEHV